VIQGRVCAQPAGSPASSLLAREAALPGAGVPALPAIYGPGRTPFQKLRDGSSRHDPQTRQVSVRSTSMTIASSLLFCRPITVAAQRRSAEPGR